VYQLRIRTGDGEAKIVPQFSEDRFQALRMFSLEFVYCVAQRIAQLGGFENFFIAIQDHDLAFRL
jgi:hypothetical protein